MVSVFDSLVECDRNKKRERDKVKYNTGDMRKPYSVDISIYRIKIYPYPLHPDPSRVLPFIIGYTSSGQSLITDRGKSVQLPLIRSLRLTGLKRTLGIFKFVL